MQTLTFRDIIKKSWLVIVVVWLACMVATFFFVKRQTPVYSTSATIVIWPQDDDASINDSVDIWGTIQNRSLIASFAKIFSSRKLFKKSFEKKEFQKLNSRKYKARTSVVPDTNIIKIVVQGPDSQIAADLANDVAYRAGRYIDGHSNLFQIEVLDHAKPEERPIKPDMRRSLSIATVFGLLLAMGCGFLFALKP
jgi:capsular polysaccharide biosynthesis protein